MSKCLRKINIDEWSLWHHGELVDIRIGPALRQSNPYLCWVAVEVLDKQTGRHHYRRGECRQIGNFAPIWITWKGQSVMVEPLLSAKQYPIKISS